LSITQKSKDLQAIPISN